MRRLSESIIHARRIYIVGVINSFVSAMQLRYALLMYGIDAMLISGYDELHAVDMCVGSDDLIIVYSVSANGKLLKMVEDMVEQDQCHKALITMNPSSSFKETSDHYIVLPKAGTPQNSLLQDIPIVSVFNEILISYLTQIKER